jgi:hypothetical protein
MGLESGRPEGPHRRIIENSLIKDRAAHRDGWRRVDFICRHHVDNTSSMSTIRHQCRQCR